VIKSLYIFGLLFFTQFIIGQNPELKVEKEVVAPIKKDSLASLRPAKAAFYSALLPGLGQAYNKKYWKIPVVYAALGTGMYFVVSNNNLYQEFRGEYRERLLGVEDTNPQTNELAKLSEDTVIRGIQLYKRNRDLAIVITAGLYILNIIDANVDAHLLQFNVNDDLSFKPMIQPVWQTKMTHQVGMSLNYQF
jgi:hypothetical protein